MLDSATALKIGGDESSSSVDDDDDDYKDGFNRSSFYQFWILLQRCMKCIMRDQMLTQVCSIGTFGKFWNLVLLFKYFLKLTKNIKLRFLSHIIIGVAIGLLYDTIGEKGSMVQQNISLLFLVLLFLVSFFKNQIKKLFEKSKNFEKKMSKKLKPYRSCFRR